MMVFKRVPESWRLVLGSMLSMLAISTLQYGWTLFVVEMEATRGWSATGIQGSFAAFVAAQALPLVLYGMLVDRFGSHVVMCTGALFVLVGWTVNALAASLPCLYLGEIIAGVGTGLVVAAAYGTALRIPKRRGLFVGITSAGYGIGAAFTFALTASLIREYGYRAAFCTIGIASALVIWCSVALFWRSIRGQRGAAMVGIFEWGPVACVLDIYRHPHVTRSIAAKALPGIIVFGMLYAMFALVAAGGLMAQAQLKPIAIDYRTAGASLAFLGISMSVVVWAGTFDRVMNGASRPLFGWLSDYTGREVALMLAFTVEAAGIYVLIFYAHDPVLFVLLSGVVFLAWGEIFSLFPSLCTDIFGERHATTNYGLLYSAKSVGALFVPYSSHLASAAGGDWSGVFSLAVSYDFLAAAIAAALFLLRMAPFMRRTEQSA